METVQLYVGLKLTDIKGEDWRIIFTDKISTVLVKMHTSTRMLNVINSGELMSSINENSFYVSEDQEIYVFDSSTLNDKQLEDYNNKKDFLQKVKECYGPSYVDFMVSSVKDKYKEYCSEFGYSKMLANRILLRWWQSGLQEGGWMDPRKRKVKNSPHASYSYKKKTGRKGRISQGIIVTDEVKEQFDYGISIYRKGKKISKSDAFAHVLYKYYRVYDDELKTVKLLPVDERPTLKQFYTYFNSQVSKPEEQRIKTSRDEFYNDHRLLFGFNRESAVKPGYIVEVDALEMDINIVSTFNKQQNVSRPIVYMMIDLYSHAIVAFHVGFDNNSMLGLSSLMMNLFDDKESLFAYHGITGVDVSYMPSQFIPHEIRCDRGSDFASNQFEKICQNLGIIRTLEHGATGSMKGLIEQSFRLFQQATLPILEHKGVILKRYDSDHKMTACLTIEQIYCLIVAFIFRHNRKCIPSFSLTKKMREACIEKTPIAIWNFGEETKGKQNPITSTNYQQSIYHTMPTDRATFCREGVRYRNLIYRCSPMDTKMMQRCKLAQTNAKKKDSSGNLLNSVEIHYDPRSIDEIYYLEDGRLGKFWLDSAKNDGLEHITWDEYEDYLQERKDIDREGLERNLQDRVSHLGFISSISLDATAPTYASTKFTKEFRKLERNEVNYNNRVAIRIMDKNDEYSGIKPTEENESLAVPADVFEDVTSFDEGRITTVEDFIQDKLEPVKSKDGKWICPADLCSFLDD